MQHKDPQLMEKIRLYAMNYYREHNQMPSIRTIADGTGMNRGSVQKYLVEMQERGIIEYDGKSIGELTSEEDITLEMRMVYKCLIALFDTITIRLS